MSRYIVDTDTLIDFSMDREPTRTALLKLIEEGAELGVCAVNVSEFYTGLDESRLAEWDRFFNALTYWPTTLTAARLAGVNRYTFARAGETLTISDALVAAVALVEQATILTSNSEDYPMPEVTTLSLRDQTREP
jgi:predicted nucleic acid-binding protein